jgi:hypothetical protein
MSSIIGQTEKHARIITVCIDSSSGKHFVNSMDPIEAILMLPGSVYIASKSMDRDNIRIICYGQ